MNGIVLIMAVVLGVAAAVPGHVGHGLGYGFIAAGHNHGYGHGHGHYSQPGVAKVQAAQAPLSYEYGVSESGPHYHKEIHQGGNFAHTIAVPVAAAVPVAHGYAHGAVGYGRGLGLGHGVY
ncbi:unnamed protein product [Allacma fusca]|uniref:Uncharacterized protein n=1 Tax=Allacma fusca TaxID=39272 RepID=A0A8J2JR04_9HEXA|nr:unnamed protein product [Allacma fusca]